MSMGRAERVGPQLRAALAALLLLLSLTACSEDPSPRPRPEVAVAVQDAVASALQERSVALAGRDQERFMRSILRSDEEFRDRQQTYFDNLAQLPIEVIDFEVDPASMLLDGDDYWADVLVKLQLRGYDAMPVVTRDRFRFSPVDEGSRYVVSSTTDAEWEAMRGVEEQPWDVGPIRVVRDSGVLGIFDDETIKVVDNVVDAVRFGRFDVAREVPDSGLVDVVVYALSDVEFLQSLPSLPVNDPQQLDAVTIPVLANAERSDSATASYRIVVNPRILSEELHVLDRLMRHELTHVALGDEAYGAPLWVSEGIAEWVSVQPISRDERRLPTAALRLARSGLEDLPTDSAFSGSRAEAWYGVSWWICEYLATTYDDSLLWILLDRTTDGDDPAVVVEDLTGLRPGQLVRRAMQMMRGQYEPKPSPTPTPSPTPSPSETTATPSETTPTTGVTQTPSS